ncbi:hypothetical protein Ahy_A06g025991 [Arachis hypogaea]|uniref:Zinc finger PMZ-type domain-containing protein n=1 Tax=Arachis hypogaea TaxID=3818 RepID=A0A445CJ44_ARAHY|nr:hypothetical protein Ahy_A06g025991 [Arachis hypogaea]
MISDNKEDFEAMYEAGDEDEDVDVGGVADPEDREFRIGIEYSSRKSIITAIRSTLSLEKSTTMFISLRYRRSMQNARRMTVGATSLSKPAWYKKRLLGDTEIQGRHFQVERLPCQHVIAYYTNQCLDWKVYVNDVHKMSEVRNVYKNKFLPLGDPETWPAFLGPTLVTNHTLRQTSKCRPKLTRYLNEMDSRKMRGSRICRLSGRQGHSHNRCPQRAGQSGVSGSGGP